MSKLILTSQGLNVKAGIDLIGKELQKDELADKTIFLIYEPYYSIKDILKRSCKMIGFIDKNIIFQEAGLNIKKIENADYIYVSEGNTFSILREMKKQGLMEPIRKAILERGGTYIGASAGAVIAGTDVVLARDFDYYTEADKDLTGLGLFDGTIIPHYTEKELKRYISCSDMEILKSYKNIYSVANNQMRVFMQ